MPGTVRKSGERGEVELDSGVQVSTDVDGFDPGERCHAVVRPEKLTIGSGNGDRPSVEGLVESSLYLGTSTQLIVQTAGRGAHDGARAEHRRGGAPRLPGGGAKVQLSWAPEHMHVVRESRTNRSGACSRRREAA